jgi:hypothetical protein
MIEGSSYPYEVPNGEISIQKRLVIIGTGYFLTSNPQTQANNSESRLAFRMNLDGGSAGTIISGISFTGTYSNTTIYVRESNIQITRCYLPNALYLTTRYTNNVAAPISGVNILQNVLGGIAYLYGSDIFSDVRVENNIILNAINITTNNTYNRTFNTFENNTLVANNGGVTLSANSFRNNVMIFGTTTPTLVLDVPAVRITNNLLDSDKLGTTNNNKIYSSTGDGPLFAGNLADNTFDPDNEYRITNERFKTMGTDGKEPGAFGGSAPYVLSGMPPVPAIYELTTTGAGSQTNGLPITIKAKSN